MKAVRIHEQGPPEVLRYEDVPDIKPKENEALIKLQAIGVNFIDIYTRSGMYPEKLPLVPGVEGAGVVSAVGSKVTSVNVGDSVSYTNIIGSYSEYAAVPANRLVRLPKGLTPELAASVTLQGMTAHYLVHDTFQIQKGHKVLIHAAAGGVGRLLVQMSKQIGAYVIATASTEEKARVAQDLGADETVVYSKEDFVDKVKTLTGSGVNAVYDSVGKSTFDKSLACLAPRGYLVLFGQSSGLVPPFSPSTLQKGSLFLTRPTLVDYVSTREDLERRANDVFNMVTSGTLDPKIFKTFQLSQAAEAHRMLESRQTTGKLLLIP